MSMGLTRCIPQAANRLCTVGDMQVTCRKVMVLPCDSFSATFTVSYATMMIQLDNHKRRMNSSCVEARLENEDMRSRVVQTSVSAGQITDLFCSLYCDIEDGILLVRPGCHREIDRKRA